MGKLILSDGRPAPLGATLEDKGIVNFALFSAHAERVELCVFDGQTLQTAFLPQCTDQVWHGCLQNAAPGLLYAYRVYGPEKPGCRFDPERFLIDPYARELFGDAHQLKCRVSAETLNPFDWGNDKPPRIPLADSVLYELHVKGATRQHPEVPAPLRGTYTGLASKPMIRHFKRLGITALNLLPIHYFIDEPRLVGAGLSNYWGYNSIGYFIPTPRYATGQSSRMAADEFRRMVRTLHAEGIEVILDVVFNHTAESDAFGPTLSFRGIDNLSYYRHRPALDDYENFSGCGNTLNLSHPRVLQLVMDSLRYWVTDMRVDGFRFDLAVSLTRDSAFLATVRQDPVLSRVKLIAEPWDLGPSGYRLGDFPAGWSEWNDRFRDDVRQFWLTRGAGANTLARRIAASSEIFNHSGRAPSASLNFIAVHDGFTLRDLVSFNERHNEQNGENNRDGSGNNFSWNGGAEGESVDPAILSTRASLARALLTTLFVSQGVPLLQGGDELGRTQQGNNNAYCQDNPLTWFDWKNADESSIEFTARLIELRRRFPQTRNRAWLSGQVGENGPDIVWWHPEGREMREEDWRPASGFLGFVLSPLPGNDEFLLILMNRDPDALEVKLPPGEWWRLLDTRAEGHAEGGFVENPCRLSGYAVQLFVQKKPQSRINRPAGTENRLPAGKNVAPPRRIVRRPPPKLRAAL